MPETVIDAALARHRAGHPVALVTVIETWGSAPRPVGSMMLVDADGGMEGSVSGGCVEGAVVLEAQEALEDGRPRELRYGVADEDAFRVGLACGGEIRLLVQPVGSGLPVEVLEAVVAARERSEPIALGFPLAGEGRARVLPVEEAQDALAAGRSRVAEGGDLFIALFDTPLRLILVGGVHIAQELAPMARACGFAPVVVDPRSAFASEARFPGMSLHHDWPDEALAALAPDHRTAVVTLTHDPKLDDPALQVALASPAFYIGCLGSRRTHAARLQRLAEAGATAEQLERLHGPVGLAIGARGAAEIAVSILAEIISVLPRG